MNYNKIKALNWLYYAVNYSLIVAKQLQITILNNLWQHLEIGGALIIGVHETLTEENTGFIALSEKLGVFQKVSD